jgi:hypothetical protein
MASTKQTLSARAFAVELLAASNGPRKVKELVEAALADPRAPKMAGKTPAATLSTQLYVAAKSGKPVATIDGTEGVIGQGGSRPARLQAQPRPASIVDPAHAAQQEALGRASCSVGRYL